MPTIAGSMPQDGTPGGSALGKKEEGRGLGDRSVSSVPRFTR
jgi:hypothetical protein